MDLSSTQHHLHSHFAHHQVHHLHSHFAHHQEMSSEHSESVQNKQQQQQQQQQQHEDMKKPRPQDAEPQKCPRCDSSNTKFCYYNNYSLTQPRYFCKACRRYWTKGGTLRNVPVGGGCRKSSKRSNYTSSSPSHFIKRAHTKEPQMVPDPTPNPVFSGLNINPYGFNFDSIMMTNANFTNSDSAMNLLSHPHSSFLQELQYGNNGLMFQNLCNYDEIGSRNGSNCVSGISEDMAAMAPYEDVLSSGVKQEANENEALFSLPWQNINNEQDLVRENWNGLFGNSAAFGLLNTPAMM